MRSVLVFLVLVVSALAATPKPDAAIEAAIRAKFAKSKISADNFRVSVKSGVAVLEGRTDIPQRKGVATRLAKTGGAREVVNKIQVGEAARKNLVDRLQKARDTKVKPKQPAPTATAAVAAAPAPAPSEPASIPRMQIKR
jgi:hypothetical protein